MTEEQLFAEEKICNGKCQDDIDKNYVHCGNCTRIKDFLAGFHEGQPKWHDLRKDPNDLPKYRHDILVTCEYRSKFKRHRETFQWDYKSDMPLHAIAWCEEPQFKE